MQRRRTVGFALEAAAVVDHLLSRKESEGDEAARISAANLEEAEQRMTKKMSMSKVVSSQELRLTTPNEVKD